MKIAIGINIFGKYKRQDDCIEILKQRAKDDNEIDLYNITFKDETNTDDAFIHLPLLERKACDIIEGSTSQKPIAKDFFDILSNQNCDYFLFLNSDVLLTKKAINLIKEGEFINYCFSRADTYRIENLSNVVPFRIEIAGFDGWAIRKDWWHENRDKFDDYIYAEPLWDVAFAVTMYNYGLTKLCNKEVYLAHEKHDLNWNETSNEAKHNNDIWMKSPYHDKWHKFVYTELIKRFPIGSFMFPLPDEEEIEKKYLKCI